MPIILYFILTAVIPAPPFLFSTVNILYVPSSVLIVVVYIYNFYQSGLLSYDLYKTGLLQYNKQYKLNRLLFQVLNSSYDYLPIVFMSQYVKLPQNSILSVRILTYILAFINGCLYLRFWNYF